MEIAILTSSRADFGFYRPLINLLKKQCEIDFRLVVFGTHLSPDHGYTIKEINSSGYENFYEVEAVPYGYKPIDIARTIGNTHLKFGEFWDKNNFDLIICIGDRYEMFAAVSASIPFNIPIAHISGGEETLGAIDNIYRHSMTLMSTYHFTNTANNAERVRLIKGGPENIYHTGSLAVDNIYETQLYNSDEFKEAFNFDIDLPFILFTFHPETVDYHMNEEYARIIGDVLANMNQKVLVTMPNADTMGGIIREALYKAAENNNNVHLIESLGSRGYYTALTKCILVLGNSSSGIIEAASFSKYVINLGNRQLGRETGENVIHCRINKQEILNAIGSVGKLPELNISNIYGNGNASLKIFSVLKSISLNKKYNNF